MVVAVVRRIYKRRPGMGTQDTMWALEYLAVFAVICAIFGVTLRGKNGISKSLVLGVILGLCAVGLDTTFGLVSDKFSIYQTAGQWVKSLNLVTFGGMSEKMANQFLTLILLLVVYSAASLPTWLLDRKR